MTGFRIFCFTDNLVLYSAISPVVQQEMPWFTVGVLVTLYLFPVIFSLNYRNTRVRGSDRTAFVLKYNLKHCPQLFKTYSLSYNPDLIIPQSVTLSNKFTYKSQAFSYKDVNLTHLPVPHSGKMAQHDILIEIGQRAKARAVL